VETFSDLEPVSGFEPLACRLQGAFWRTDVSTLRVESRSVAAGSLNDAGEVRTLSR